MEKSIESVRQDWNRLFEANINAVATTYEAAKKLEKDKERIASLDKELMEGIYKDILEILPEMENKLAETLQKYVEKYFGEVLEVAKKYRADLDKVANDFKKLATDLIQGTNYFGNYVEAIKKAAEEIIRGIEEEHNKFKNEMYKGLEAKKKFIEYFTNAPSLEELDQRIKKLYAFVKEKKEHDKLYKEVRELETEIENYKKALEEGGKNYCEAMNKLTKRYSLSSQIPDDNVNPERAKDLINTDEQYLSQLKQDMGRKLENMYKIAEEMGLGEDLVKYVLKSNETHNSKKYSNNTQ